MFRIRWVQNQIGYTQLQVQREPYSEWEAVPVVPGNHIPITTPPNIPAMKENPRGLHQRYTVSKSNGEPTDPNAIYFVLRLDAGGRDKIHVKACREAAEEYCRFVTAYPSDAFHLAQLATDLKHLLDELERE